MNCDYCGHMLSDHAVNYYASELIRVRCFIDSFVDDDGIRYYKCKCEDILINMDWIDEEQGWDYRSPDEIITNSPTTTTTTESFKNIANKKSMDIKNDRD